MVARQSNYILMYMRMLACTFAAGLCLTYKFPFLCDFAHYQMSYAFTSVSRMANICHMGSISMYDEIIFFLSLRYTLQYNVNMDFHSLLAEKFCMCCLLFFVVVVFFFVFFFCLFKDFFMNTISVNSLDQDLISNNLEHNEKGFKIPHISTLKVLHLCTNSNLE